MSDLLYNEKSIPSIVKYAQRLENKTIDEVNFEQSSYKGVASPTKDYVVEGKKLKVVLDNILKLNISEKKLIINPNQIFLLQNSN